MMRRLPIAAAATAALVALPLLHAAEQPPSPEMQLFQRALDIVRGQYVEPVADDKLIEAALSGMVNSLDPHSAYMTQDAFDEMRVETRGAYGGIGLEITQENGQIKIVSPIDDTPAAAAGLKPGDIVTKVDGEPIGDFTLTEIVARLRGPVATKVVLTINRTGRDPFEATLTRANVTLKSVKSHLENGAVGYLRISSFIANTDEELRAAIAELEKAAANKLTGFVLDLRNDPGGLLDQAVAVADAFLDKGEIVAIRGRQADAVKRYEATAGDLAHGLPIVVLINGGSASAAEIVAGALHDDHRAILLGTRSFGKGSVQTIIPLGGRGALRLTTARYVTPSGRSIQGAGITPDIEVEPARLQRLAVAASQRESDLRNALKNTDAAPVASPPPVAATAPNVPPGTVPAAAPKPDVEAALIGTPEDYQLSRAVDLLTGMALFDRRSVD